MYNVMDHRTPDATQAACCTAESSILYTGLTKLWKKLSFESHPRKYRSAKVKAHVESCRIQCPQRLGTTMRCSTSMGSLLVNGTMTTQRTKRMWRTQMTLARNSDFMCSSERFKSGRLVICMHRLGVDEWVHVLRKLPAAYHGALALVVPGVRMAVVAWAHQVKRLAKLVTFADGCVVGIATPTDEGYTVDTRGVLPTFHSPRRMFVHQYALAVAMAAGAGGRTLTSMLAFDQAVARSVPLPNADPLGDDVTWPSSRITTRLGDVLPAARQHARFYLAMRLQPPRRHRGRRARRWTKVAPVDALPLPCGLP